MHVAQAFRAAAQTGTCALCGQPGAGLDAHHVLPRSKLKRLLAGKGKVVPPSVLYDPRNAVGLHRTPCHEWVTSRARTLPRSAVPDRTWEFAREHGLEWLLEAECPDVP